jgi:hypothetical protein
MQLEDRGPYHFTQNGIRTIEQKYQAQYLGYWCCKRAGGGWAETPLDVFYVENPDRSKGHTNYFGMFVSDGRVMITNAESCFSESMTGILENGVVYVSRYRHDMVPTPLGKTIDGGRDYVKTSVVPDPAQDQIHNAERVLSGMTRLVSVSVKDGKFEFSEIQKQDESEQKSEPV